MKRFLTVIIYILCLACPKWIGISISPLGDVAKSGTFWSKLMDNNSAWAILIVVSSGFLGWAWDGGKGEGEGGSCSDISWSGGSPWGSGGSPFPPSESLCSVGVVPIIVRTATTLLLWLHKKGSKEETELYYKLWTIRWQGLWSFTFWLNSVIYPGEVTTGATGVTLVAPKFSDILTLFQPGRQTLPQHCRGRTKNFPTVTSLYPKQRCR